MMMEAIAMIMETIEMMMETIAMMMEKMMMKAMMMEKRGKGRGPLAFSTKISPQTFSERSEKKNIMGNVQNLQKKKK